MKCKCCGGTGIDPASPKTYPIGEEKRWSRKFIRKVAIWSGEYRHPKKGEWFLSGAIPKAYEAYNDMSRKYRIAKIVDDG